MPQDLKDFLLERKVITRNLLRKIVHESDLESVKEMLEYEISKLKRNNRRKFALRVYFEGDKAVLGGLQSALSPGQKQSLISKLKTVIEQL